jgi:diguanylate cyclase (GGDEF)-like protein/PAS domain S-box-containing protein
VIAGLACWRDVSDERRAVTALRQAEGRFRTAFEHAPIGMAIIGLDGRYHEVNQAFCDITGYSSAELARRTYQDLTHPDDLQAHRAEVRRLVRGEVPALQVEKRYVGPTGLPVWVLVSAAMVCDDDARPLYVLSQVLDIDQRKRREEQLQWQAERDSLTGLWNRHRFEEELVRRRSLSERHGEVTAVILLDLDNFKAINDTYGHGAGDEVLRTVASVLSASVRAPDIASRYGGDEFAVVLPHTTREEASRMAERLLGNLSQQTIVIDGHPVTISGSAGVADDTAGPDPVAAADHALYAAKRARARN